jgi:Pyruvate/2-oxoacid:ferredoxin oxidoreductase delta subunit
MKSATGCGRCIKDCPMDCIQLVRIKRPRIKQGCVECRTCFKVCPQQAVEDVVIESAGGCGLHGLPGGLCQVPEGRTGACGALHQHRRRAKTHRSRCSPMRTSDKLPRQPEAIINKPMITAIGAGGTYPDYVPAPYILQ